MPSVRVPSFLQFHPTFEGSLRAAVILLLVILLVQYSTLFEKEYNETLMNLYSYPWWRFLLVFLLISAMVWCPRVGILTAFLVVFYLRDMRTLLVPLNG